MTLTGLLAFVSAAVMARMGGEPKEPPESPKPEVKEPEPEKTAEPEPEPEDEDDEKAALKREIDELRAHKSLMLHTLARERDEKVSLLAQLAHAQMRVDHWATLYSGMQPPMQSNPQLQAQQQFRAQDIRPRGGFCMCVPGRADVLRPRHVDRIRGTHADMIIMDDPTQ